jgi:DNA-binding NtrC family response regulator
MIARTIESLLIGHSTPMRKLRAQIERFAPTRLPALIQGPTGSGKELVARALHIASRRQGAFVAFNVCAVADSMFEDALFGHVKGAFTGATADRAGYLAEANGGTVFLDEVGGTAIASQVKLLRAVETGTFRSVGAGSDRVSDFRLVAASNEPLERLVIDGRFRRDLLHRLAGIILEVPPLAARPEDIVLLATHFLGSMHSGKAVTLTSGAAACLREHSWPGNVRELKHAIERAAVLSVGHAIDREDIERCIVVESRGQNGQRLRADPAEARHLLHALIECEWDTAAVADRLGVHRATVYRRMRQCGIAQRIRTTEPGDVPSNAFAQVGTGSRHRIKRIG